MSIFGWDYPAGCSGTPYDNDEPCGVCGRFDCDCKECPVCGEAGNVDCFVNHHVCPHFADDTADPHAGINLAVLEQVFADAFSPRNLYRMTYKYTDCGPAVGMQFQQEPGEGGEWVYNTSLPDKWHTGEIVQALEVSSIVEGTDAVTSDHVVPVYPIATLFGRFYAAVEAVNAEAAEIASVL